jgi:hypothetical protein
MAAASNEGAGGDDSELMMDLHGKENGNRGDSEQKLY